MKTTITPLKLITGSLAVAALLCLPVSTPAATISLTIDPTLSSLTLSGNAFGVSYASQGATGAIDFFGGTIWANDLGGGSLSFLGSTAITGLANAGAGSLSYAPYPGPDSSAPRNFGVIGSGIIPTYGAVTVRGIYDGLSMTLGGTVANGAAPSAMTDQWTAGMLDWGATYGPPPGTLVYPAVPAGINTAAQADTSASLVSWDGTTLILPVTFHTTGSNRNEYWTGTIVATVPEPSTVALALVGLGLLAATRARARRV